eukprot:TRINITY_DN12115_c0_g2_i14.p1 TRINITY_DN12115_c0_g2~~TRINITY_DN12115_c0_g2_i14.p1  ORF type:complete len:170 (-),score=45.77 TRINITY_DN12115_c0_g2_i14:168-677(-)
MCIRDSRWIVDTPNKRPFIKCRQNILDKHSEASGDIEEVVQIFRCRSKYKGNGRITLRLESIDPRVSEISGLEARLNIKFQARRVGGSLRDPVPDTVPTLPSPEAVPEEVVLSNPYNKWRPKPKKDKEPVFSNYYDDYFEGMGADDFGVDFDFDFNGDYSDFDFDFDYL